MASIADRVLDNGLTVLDTEANILHICSAEPLDFSEIAGLTLGNKTSLSIGSPAARSPSGRKVTVGAFTDGNVTGTGTASHWAIADTVNSRLLASGSLSSSQGVTSGNTFSLAAFDIGIPGPA